MKFSAHHSSECLAKELLNHWLQNSERFGTLESIVEWWLLEQQIKQRFTEAPVILEKLVAAGLVVKWQEADGRIYYRLNRNREPDARAWLETPGRTGH